MRNRTISKTDKFILRQRTRKSNGKNYYELSLATDYFHWTTEDRERIRDMLDPTRNRSGRYGTAWKYSNRLEAEKALLTLLMVMP